MCCPEDYNIGDWVPISCHVPDTLKILCVPSLVQSQHNLEMLPLCARLLSWGSRGVNYPRSLGQKGAELTLEWRSRQPHILCFCHGAALRPASLLCH